MRTMGTWLIAVSNSIPDHRTLLCCAWLRHGVKSVSCGRECLEVILVPTAAILLASTTGQKNRSYAKKMSRVYLYPVAQSSSRDLVRRPLIKDICEVTRNCKSRRQTRHTLNCAQRPPVRSSHRVPKQLTFSYISVNLRMMQLCNFQRKLGTI